MNIQEIEEALNLKTVAGLEGFNHEVTGCYIGDLMSLAMAQLEAGYLWITIQTNLNVVAVASLKEAGGVILADGAEPDVDAVAKAQEEGIPILCSEESAYALAKRLGALGI